MLRSRISRRVSRFRPATRLQSFLLNRRLPLPGCFPVLRRILRVIPAEQQYRFASWASSRAFSSSTSPLPLRIIYLCFYDNSHRSVLLLQQPLPFRVTHRFQRRSPQPRRAPRRRLASWSRGLRPLSLLRVRAAFLLLQASHRVELCVKTILPSYLPVLRDKYRVRNYGANMLLMFESGFANTESTSTLLGAAR